MAAGAGAAGKQGREQRVARATGVSQEAETGVSWALGVWVTLTAGTGGAVTVRAAGVPHMRLGANSAGGHHEQQGHGWHWLQGHHGQQIVQGWGE